MFRAHSIALRHSSRLFRQEACLVRQEACLAAGFSSPAVQPARCRSASAKLPIYSFNNVNKLHTSVVRLADELEIPGPAFADSISEGDMRWLKQVGDSVTEDELVGEIETDKTSMEVLAPQSGVITAQLVADGDKVVAKQALYKLAPGAGGAPSSASAPAPAAAAKPAAPAATQPAATKSDVSGPAPTSPPPVTQPPKQPLSSTPASQVPVQQATGAQQPEMKFGSSVAVPTGVPTDRAITGERSETRVKMNRMRNRIADRLKGAQNTYAMLTTFQEIDMSRAIALRAANKDAFLKKHGVKLGYMSAFIKASAYALMDQPVVNAVIEDGEQVYRHYVDVSIAVASPKGLVVPVLRNVESMNYAHIEKETTRLGMLARDGKLAVEDMEGGTFTVSNGGVFGSLFGTPIINPPQSAILGMHAINDKPVAVNGKVEIRPIMVVALTYDHRLIDGREAVTFLRKIKQAVEDPAIIHLEL